MSSLYDNIRHMSHTEFLAIPKAEEHKVCLMTSSGDSPDHGGYTMPVIPWDMPFLGSGKQPWKPRYLVIKKKR